MSTPSLVDSLWGEAGYCSLLLKSGFSVEAAVDAFKLLQQTAESQAIRTDLVKSTWLVTCIQKVKLALVKDTQAREYSMPIYTEIVRLLGTPSGFEPQDYLGDSFSTMLSRLKKHWDLEAGFLGRLRSYKFSDQALQALLEDLEEWAGLHEKVPAFPKIVVDKLWHIPEYALQNGPRELAQRHDLQCALVPRISKILGEPAPGIIEAYLLKRMDFEYGSA